MQVIELLCFMGLATLSQQKFKSSMCLRKEEVNYDRMFETTMC